MAKIGLLVLNEGKWLDTQIVPREWIRESASPLVKESKYYDYGCCNHCIGLWEW